MARPLDIYLQDHLAGATFGLQLLERCRCNNGGSELAEPLAALAAEIEADRQTLAAILRRLGGQPSRVKTSVAWALEKGQRLKPNERLWRYTPLARLLELESLAIGITGKKAMWRVLEDVTPRGDLEGYDFTALVGRADDQLRRVEALRLDAARAAFGTASPSSMRAGTR
jgi:hypothetical protein